MENQDNILSVVSIIKAVIFQQLFSAAVHWWIDHQKAVLKYF